MHQRRNATPPTAARALLSCQKGRPVQPRRLLASLQTGTVGGRMPVAGAVGMGSNLLQREVCVGQPLGQGCLCRACVVLRHPLVMLMLQATSWA